MDMYKIICKNLVTKNKIKELHFKDKKELKQYIKENYYKHEYWIYEKINDEYVFLALL